jgi:hypothetical protein
MNSEKMPAETKEAAPSLADIKSIINIGLLWHEQKWALVVNESVAYLARTSGEMAINNKDANGAMEVKEAALLASQTFRGISKVENPEWVEDDLRVADETGKVAESLEKCSLLSQLSERETNSRFAETINAYNSKDTPAYGFSVNALSLRFVEICRELSIGQRKQRIDWIRTAAEAISTSFKSIEEDGKELKKDNEDTAKKIDLEIEKLTLLASGKRS